MLQAHPNELTMDVFDSTAREILSNVTLVSKVITRWFLLGDQVLCDAARAIIDTHHGKDFPLEFDSNELKSANSASILFVARKTIGYLFMRPISATSGLISLMRHTVDDEALAELGALLSDPLLLNFIGKSREYALQQSSQGSGKVKLTIDRALEDIDSYLDDLHSVGTLSALHPSETQREAHHRYFSHLMTESYKAAEAQSVLFHLVSKSVMLYGRKSICYLHDNSNEPPRRMEIPLQNFNTEMEFPRMEYLDPFGLDYKLRVFKSERFKT